MTFPIGGAVAALSIFAAQSDSSKPIPAYKITTPPVIDGKIDELGEWKDVPTFGGLVDSDTNQPAVDGARYWLGYDDKFIYFAVRANDSEPQAIHATEYRTNVGLAGDDFVEFSVDVSGSLSDFSKFQVNPRGATNLLLSGGRAAKREWTGEIEAKAQITRTGYEVEAKIPWKLLNVRSKGPHDVRFNFGRFVARTGRFFTYAFTNSGHNAETPTWHNVDLPRPQVDRSIKLLPYLYTGYDPQTKATFNSGLDLKTSLTDQVQLVGTINPDFRNIENQILSLDFSRFARLAGESRPFFQEGSDYLGSALLATQRIKSFDVGVNSYGKLTDRTNYGFLNTTSFGRENDQAATFTDQLDPTTNVRVAETSLAKPGVKNDAYLVRLDKQVGTYDVFLRDMGTKDSIAGFGRSTTASINQSSHGLTFFTEYDYIASTFQPRLGFAPEVDARGFQEGMHYNKSFDRGIWNDYGGDISVNDFQHADGSPYRHELNLALFGTLRKGQPYLFTAADFANFEGSKDHLYSVETGFPRTDRYRVSSVHVDWGEQAGHAYQSTSFHASRRLWNRFQIDGRYQVVRFGDVNDQLVVGGNYDLGNDRSIAGRIVKQGGDVNAYLALRRSGNAGAEYFLIFGDPNARTTHASLVLKVAIPFLVNR